MEEERELKGDVMVKRSQNKSRFSTFLHDSYKKRYFSLTPTSLKYYDGRNMDRTHRVEKGSVPLHNAVAIAEIEDGLLGGRIHAFQIVYTSEMGKVCTLYIVATSNQQKAEWIEALRSQATRCRASLSDRYHPAPYSSGRFCCCSNRDKLSVGCRSMNEQSGAMLVFQNAPVSTNNLQSSNSAQLQAVSSSISRGPSSRADGLQRANQNESSQRNVPTSGRLGELLASDASASASASASGSSQTSPKRTADIYATELRYLAIYDYEPNSSDQIALEQGEPYYLVNETNEAPRTSVPARIGRSLGASNDSEQDTITVGREGWLKVRSFTNEIGYVPAVYLRAAPTLDAFEWFYGDVTRKQSEQLLAAENRDGCFLVRASETTSGQYTLSLYTTQVDSPSPQPSNGAGACVDGKTYHYKIRQLLRRSHDSPGLNNDCNAEDAAGVEYYINEKRTFGSVVELVAYHKRNSDGLIVRLRCAPTRQARAAKLQALLAAGCRIELSELTVLDEVGRGQFGVVLRAIWRESLVAVKQLRAGSMHDDDFVDEARSMRQLRHPNLVQLFGVVERPLCIVTEFMRNGSLRTFLHAHRALVLRDETCDSARAQPSRVKCVILLLSIALQVCDAMVYLEAKQFIHRDLATRNCLVGECDWRTDEPDADVYVVVKVADLGLARHVVDDEYTGSSGGKVPVRWAAPEVLTRALFSSKSDVWSFGVLCWELFTAGETPYAGRSNSQVCAAVLDEHAPVRLERPAGCPADLYALLCTSWQRMPDQRPTFRQIRTRLDALRPARHSAARSGLSVRPALAQADANYLKLDGISPPV